MYRLMLGEAWVTRRGERVSFYEREGLLAVVQRWALAPLVTDPDAADFDGVHREMEPGTYVWYADPATGRNLPARTNSYPFQDMSYSVNYPCFNCAKKDTCTDLKRIQEAVQTIHNTSREDGHQGSGTIVLACCAQNAK